MTQTEQADKLFDIPVKKPNAFCRTCIHRERHLVGNTLVLQYCAKRISNRTSNGMLKIKCKTPACELYELQTLENKK